MAEPDARAQTEVRVERPESDGRWGAAIAAVVIVVLLVLGLWWWFSDGEPPSPGSEMTVVPAASTTPAPPEQPQLGTAERPLRVNVVTLPDNINVTVWQGTTAKPAAPAEKPSPPAAPQPAKKGEITPELLERQYKRYLHHRTQEFLLNYPVIR